MKLENNKDMYICFGIVTLSQDMAKTQSKTCCNAGLNLNTNKTS